MSEVIVHNNHNSQDNDRYCRRGGNDNNDRGNKKRWGNHC